MLLPLDTVAAFLYLVMVGLNRPLRGGDAAQDLLLMSLAALFIFLTSKMAGLLAMRYLHSHSGNGVMQRQLGGTIQTGLRVLVVGTYILVLSQSTWSSSIAHVIGFGDNPAVLCIIGITPYLLFNFFSWYAIFPLHCLSAPGEWGRGAYLLHRARYSFFILGIGIPLLIVGSAFEAESLAKFQAQYGLLFELLSLPLVVWIFPAFLRFFWGCRRMPDGATRDRILALQKKTGVRFSQICVWNLGGRDVANAAVVGIFPPFRYLFLSEGLLANMSESEVDAVVCHEMGHVRHGHLLLYLVLSLPVITLIGQILSVIEINDTLAVPAYVLGLAMYFRFGFAFFSRRLERQADLFALEAQGSAAPLCNSLERIGILAGNVRKAPSWHHMSIAERVEFLQAAEDSPPLAEAHHEHVKKLKLMAWLFALSFLPHLIISATTTPTSMHHAKQSLPLANEKNVETPQTLAHWRSLRQLMPDDARAPEKLARHYLAANTPRSREQAQRYAREALSRAHSATERERLQKLLGECERATATPTP